MPETTVAAAWNEWSAATFARAVDEDRPVVLALGAAWCEASCHMDHGGYRDPEVVRTIENGFVPVRVDVDRRPDIAERYGLGGWPTTLCLTPDGEVLSGGVLLDGAALVSLLRKVADTFQRRRSAVDAEARDAVARRAAERDAASRGDGPAGDPSPVHWLEACILEAFDTQYAGLGETPKMPHLGALRFALRRHRETGDPDLGQIVTQSLDAMARKGLHDPIGGGFYHYAESLDWSGLHSEKLLEVNADALRLYLEAWLMLERSSYRDIAEAVSRCALKTLWSKERKCFFNSQRADSRYHCFDSAEARAAVQAPVVDPHAYVSSNARMVSVLFVLSAATGDDSLASHARDALEQQLVMAYQPGGGIAHLVEPDPSVRGLLVDQVLAVAATLDAHEASGDDVYLDLALEIMSYALGSMRDARSGGFLDRASLDDGTEIGLLREPMMPIDLNGEAAQVLLRLARVSGQEEFRQCALEVIDACRSSYQSYGLSAAPYVLAVADAEAESA